MERHIVHCDAILFDLDGVLIDSTECIVRHWREWASRHNLDLDTVLKEAHGIRTVETIRRTAPHLDAEKEAAAYTANEVADTDGVTVIPGARRLLEGIPEGLWAVVTSGGRKLARVRLERTGLPVPEVLITSDDVKKGKPDPEPYHTGAKLLGFPPERCIVLEDSPAGIKSGIKAGIRVFGITTTHSRDELQAAGAEAILENLSVISVRESVGDFRLTIEIVQT